MFPCVNSFAVRLLPALFAELLTGDLETATPGVHTDEGGRCIQDQQKKSRQVEVCLIMLQVITGYVTYG